MAFSLGYCTVEYADLVNVDSTFWTNSTLSQKELAISIGKSYIDKYYTCLDSEDWGFTEDVPPVSTAPDEIQMANAILAERYTSGVLTDNTDDVSGKITSKRVKAGSVESETTYQGYNSKSPGWLDPNPDITLMVSEYCSFGNKSKNLIRV